MGNETEQMGVVVPQQETIPQNFYYVQQQPGQIQLPNNIQGIINQNEFDPAKHGPRIWETPVAIGALLLTIVSMNSFRSIVRKVEMDIDLSFRSEENQERTRGYGQN